MNRKNNTGEISSMPSNTHEVTATCLKGIQDSLCTINKRLNKFDDLEKQVSDLKNEICGENGLDGELKYVSEQCQYNADDITELKNENTNLRKEVDLLRSVVISMDRKLNVMDREITDLRGRSMRDNILVHNFAHSPNEDLSKSVPDAIKSHLGIDAKFVRIHRNGFKRGFGGKPISITGKLEDRNQKDQILAAMKEKKSTGERLPFHITAQEPPQLIEERKKLYEKSNSFRKQNINTRISGKHIILPNGSQYAEEIPLLTNADVLQIPETEQRNLENVRMYTTECEKRQGTQMFASGSEVRSIDDVQNLYRKVCILPDSASSDHRILVYRFKDEARKLTENYHDDGEHGAGRRLLQYMRDNEMCNIAVVISKWNGERKIGFERFGVMEYLVCSVYNELED
ncbi:hypothetical protein FSP39_014330 [Pinctada imbricata]|uniref:Impact N-terminal domain-containing protein n=1 Tax=Pinctada imbricata TaxID=66713 RepID=A0AA88XWK3_PINIB|nr:hypothetical protein FSP39_014330 [Pinctada imbricata]